ncbi:hypothetical protein K505DRAFT_49869 [Melanomma pulvis-pyrius CBS 109.77]|uniref:Secreted protein n=1 Tax=Melanomma pulvis-pyrius CBS 109.77 TaxID=1314802 RepID=A0A6A6X8J3_9PLEO|nr:hypothetical protein K505DRAFT_49869 [Melanomma pulvis-pyrius CBS 109.77]
MWWEKSCGPIRLGLCLILVHAPLSLFLSEPLLTNYWNCGIRCKYFLPLRTSRTADAHCGKRCTTIPYSAPNLSSKSSGSTTTRHSSLILYPLSCLEVSATWSSTTTSAVHKDFGYFQNSDLPLVYPSTRPRPHVCLHRSPKQQVIGSANSHPCVCRHWIRRDRRL